MTGILLLSENNCFADEDGKVSWGPAADKLWVRRMIFQKKVFVGYHTWKSIQSHYSLLDLPSSWQFVNPMDATIHFGGPKSFKSFPPDRFIIHKTRTPIAGMFFDMNWLEDNYELTDSSDCPEYTELIYAKK